jgi:uncharacterized membrane protein YhiD involved in acid resistance
MTTIRNLWHDEGTGIACDRALTSAVAILVLAAAILTYLDARDELYERMSHKRKFVGLSTVVAEMAPRQV